MTAKVFEDPVPGTGPRRALGLFDATMLVAGSMVGSGIFLVSPYMARLVGSPGWLLVAWVITGVLTLSAALSYGELAAMMPRAGGPYVYLREAFSPLAGFLFGWTWLVVVQTGSIAALGVALARFAGLLVPGIAEDLYIVVPVHVASHYALSLSTAQLVALAVILVLSWTNARGLDYGRVVQNVFTGSNMLALLGLVIAGVFLGARAGGSGENFTQLWTIRRAEAIAPGLTAASALGLFAALGIAQTGSFFSATGWDNITLAAEEIRRPARNIPLSLAIGATAVIGLYLMVNVGYLRTLPFEALQEVPADRVASATLERILPGTGGVIMAFLIVIATFGCNNAQILSGARLYYAMARDGLFFDMVGRLNPARVPGRALGVQALWASMLVLPRTYDPATKTYGNLYGDLLDYVTFSILLFYSLAVLALFRLRATRSGSDRPYRVVGYPFVPAVFLIGAGSILMLLLVYRPYTTWPGLGLVLMGIPIFLFFRRRSRSC